MRYSILHSDSDDAGLYTITYLYHLHQVNCAITGCNTLYVNIHRLMWPQPVAKNELKSFYNSYNIS